MDVLKRPVGPACETLLAALDQAAIVAVTDRSGRITYCNVLFCQISGYAQDELIGANHRLLQSGEHSPEFFRQMYRTIGRGGIWRGTICNRRKSGDLYWVDTTIVPALGQDGRPEAYIAIRVDVTHHKQVQDELREAKAAAERAAQAKERFIANLSHELRTPLTALIGFAEVLMSADLPSNQRACVASIHDSAELLKVLVNDVWTLARNRAGATQITPAPTKLRELAAWALSTVARSAAEKGIVLDCRISADVPDLLMVDPIRMRQVLVNLLANAVKFTERGSVTLTFDWTEGVLHGEVIDTGCGFAMNEKERLFSAFEQAIDNRGRHLEGTGLGLPICRGLVSAMGGAIDADGNPGKGARFWFTIPCAPAEEAHSPAPADTHRSGADILVVEDSVEIQILMNTVLKAAGHRVEIVANGKLGVEALKRRPFDVCFMDLRMPVMNGAEAVKAIRLDSDRRVRETPVVMVSAEVDEGRTDDLCNMGFDGAVAKPLHIARLLQTVECWRGQVSNLAAAGDDRLKVAFVE